MHFSPQHSVLGTLLFVGSSLVAEAAPARAKVDQAVRAALAAGHAKQQVIITVNPGCRAAITDSLGRHGDTVTGEFRQIDAVAGEVHSRDIDALAASGCVKAI